MLLINMDEWLGPGCKMSPEEKLNVSVVERHVCFATNLQLGEALQRILLYQKAYNDRYRLAVNFRLLSVSNVEYVDEQTREEVGVEWVESLPIDLDSPTER